jgi:hypothetical protein
MAIIQGIYNEMALVLSYPQEIENRDVAYLLKNISQTRHQAHFPKINTSLREHR